MPASEEKRYPLIAFRPGDRLMEHLQARTDAAGEGGYGPLSRTARRELERYSSMLEQSLPPFSAGEAALIADALNGTMTMAETAHLLWAEIADAIRFDHLDVKWGVDGEALVTRLRALTPFEALAVADAVERFWSGPYCKEGPIEEQLRAVGLVQ